MAITDDMAREIRFDAGVLVAQLETSDGAYSEHRYELREQS